MSVVTGKPGTVYECPDHGRFVPTRHRYPGLPRHEHDKPEAKCMAWLPGGRMYCGKFCPAVAK